MAAGADDDQERKLAPTERRLERAREEGQVPRSRSLSTALMLGAAAGTLALLGRSLFDASRHLLARGLTFGYEEAFRDDFASLHGSALVADGLLIAMPVCVATALAAIAASLALGGWSFSTRGLTPDFSRLSPLKGLGKLFSLNATLDLGKLLLESVVVVTVVVVFVRSRYAEFATLDALAGKMGHAQLGSLVVSAFGVMVVALAMVAAIDVGLSIWRHRRDLRMSLQDIRDESREADGDPHVKAKIRSQQRQMAQRRMMQAVPDADVVVTNPTRYAVALRYDEARSAVPRVVAKGTGEVAARIREIAVESGVALVEAPPLARALHKHCEIGADIPQALYTGVAQVIAFIYNLRSTTTRPSATPYAGLAVEVPAELDPLTAGGSDAIADAAAEGDATVSTALRVNGAAA